MLLFSGAASVVGQRSSGPFVGTLTGAVLALISLGMLKFFQVEV